MKKNNDALIDEAMKTRLRALKMPGALKRLEEITRHAEQEHLSYKEFLHEMLMAEIASRDASAIRTRIHDARFPEDKTLDGFDCKATEGVEPALLAELSKGGFIERHENVVLLGPVGTGKTHLATALGMEACRRRQRVAFFRVADLVRLLMETRDRKELGRLERRMLRADLLILDELGFVPFDRQGGELLFNLLSQRHNRKSTIVTTNLAFSEWPSVFAGDEKLTAALLDRLAETAIVITTRGKSYRMRKRAAVAQAA